MRSFNDFLNEAKLRGSKGLPSDYIEDMERKTQRELGIRVDDPSQMRQYGPQIMNLIERSKELTFRGLSGDQKSKRTKDLEDLAKEVIYAEYSNILDNVDLNIKLVTYGNVPSELSGIQDIPQNPASKSQQEIEMEKDVEKDDDGGEKKDKKESFLDKLFKKKETEKEGFVGTEEYKERVDKAKLINNIIQGEAKNTKKILHSEIVKQGLTRIFGEAQGKEIFKVWDDISKVADKLDWIIPIEDKADMMKNQMGGMAGAVEVEWQESEESDEDEDEDAGMGGSDEIPSQRSAEEILKELEGGSDIGDLEEEIGELLSSGNPVINSVGVDFPMLLHETVKGIYELIAAAYLPSDASDDIDIKKARVVKKAVTSFEDEAEDFRYGPLIAAALRDFINDCKGYDRYPNMREYVFGKMVLLEAKDFLSLMKGILEKSDKAKNSIEEIISEIIEEIREYEIGLIDDDGENWGDNDYTDDDDLDRGNLANGEENEIDKLIRKSNDNSDVSNSEEDDYSKMSKRDLQEVIDKAIDDEDWATLDKIKPFMKESLEWRLYESEIKRILK